ncbi:MAG: branched-chain amino acid aminotransferase [Alphaproteobacteria bacterium]|nr:branched-chain amino acid aminotransferase [Alphaproteobacteria bacterium]
MALVPFDDRDGAIWMDGKLVPWREAKLHVLAHSMHYGNAVFEGERAYNGSIFKMREHSERLLRSAELLDFKIPYTAEEIDAAKMAALKANGVKDAYVRPIAWRGCDGLGVSALEHRIHLAIACWAWPSYFSPEARAKGIKLIMSSWARPSPTTAPTAAKAAGLYMICTISKNEAERQGCSDALMLDWRGQVAEATGANFFMVKDGGLHTPMTDCILDGITRRTVMDLARAKGIPVIERAIWPEELKDADEVFLTGTAAEVTAIGQIGEWAFTPGPITAKLAEAYEKLTRG